MSSDKAKYDFSHNRLKARQQNVSLPVTNNINHGSVVFQLLSMSCRGASILSFPVATRQNVCFEKVLLVFVGEIVPPSWPHSHGTLIF